MPGKSASNTPVSKGWPSSVRSAMLQVIALAQFAMTHARGWATDTGHSLDPEILGRYVSLKLDEDMRGYFRHIRPLFTAIAERSHRLGLV